MIRVTACICTHNRPDYLRDCLDGLAQQTVGPEGFRILVVDSGSTGAAAGQIRALVARVANARLLRVDRLGLSVARNAGFRTCTDDYIAYLDDDAIPEPGWIAAIQRAAADTMPALLGGAIAPLWEAPLPDWWPARLRGVLSITEITGRGEYRRPGVAAALEPVGANMIIRVTALQVAGGFAESLGRTGKNLLSDEEKILAWTMQDGGETILYDSRIRVHHQIQAERLTMPWLLSRLYWQGLSRVRSGRILGEQAAMRREAIRRVIVFCLFAPVALIPARSHWLLALRWRWAYAQGFLRAYISRPSG